jgi:hypothetical protein
MPRFSTGDGLAATFMWASGSGPGKFERVGGPLGLLETSNTNSDWKLDTSKALTLQLYGVVMRAGGSSTVATRYLMSVGISLVAGSEKSPTAQTSVAVLNHPELLSGIWELSPGRNPSKTDVDGDGVPDWQLASGQPFDPATLIGEQWVTSSDTLTSTAISDFNQITVVDLRIQSLAAGATATFAIDAARSGDRCVPIQVALQRQTDGTQTLTVRQKFNDTGYQQLLSYSGLPAEPVDVKLVIEPVAPTMGVTLNGVPRGAIPLTFATVSTTSKSVRIGGTGGSVGFNYARVRLLQVSP